MTQELIIAVLLLGLTGLVWTMTLATFSQDRPPRKDPGLVTNLPDSASVTQNEGSTKTSQVET
jgi:hypothetical protein